MSNENLKLFSSPEAGWADFNMDLLKSKGNIGEDRLRASYICPVTQPLFIFFSSILADDTKFYNKYRLVEFDAEGWKWYLGYVDNQLFILIDNFNEHTYNSMPFVCHALRDDIRPEDLARAWLNTFKESPNAWLGWDYAYSDAQLIFKDSMLDDDEKKQYSHEIEMTKAYVKTLENLL